MAALVPPIGRRLVPWILLFALPILASPSQAKTWLVLIDGSGDAPTIQAAVDSAASGDSVLVGPGTYHESVHIASESLTLHSQAGRDQTSMVGPPATPALRFSGSMDPAPDILGFTFTGSAGTDVDCSLWPRFESCAFMFCGDGALMRQERGATFISCLFASNGDGLHADYFFGGGAACISCEIRDNAGYGAWDAGSFTDCVISDNGASGIFAKNEYVFPGRTITITNCRITGNEGYGVEGSSYTQRSISFQISSSQISDNLQGGLWAAGFDPVGFGLTDCEVSGNGGYAAYGRPGVGMLRCVVWGNALGVSAAGYSPSNGSISLVESTYHDNGTGLAASTSQGVYPAHVTVTRSIVSGTRNGRGVPQCGHSMLTLSCSATLRAAT